MTGAGGLGPQIPLPLADTERLTFELFCAGRNAELLAVLRHIAAGEEGKNLYLWGEPGAGKSHLLHAVCNALAGHGRRAALLPLRQHEALGPELLEGLEQFDVICIDDMDAIAGQRQWEQALFHLFNRARDARRPLVMSARTGPQASPLALADLRSRLGWDLVYRVLPLDEAERFVVLRSRAGQRGMKIPDEVLEYLARRIPRDMHSLFSWLQRLDHESLAAGKRLTVPFVRELLEASADEPPPAP